MAGAITRSNPPAIALTFILFLHPLLLVAATNIELDNWLAASNAKYQLRSAEIARGIDVGLEQNLLEAEAQQTIITVRQDGLGNFTKIKDAVRSIPAGNTKRTIIFIGPGVYKEKVFVDRSRRFVTFHGEPGAKPRITYHDTAAKLGTWNSATVIVESDYFVASNIIFENTAPNPAPGEEGGQAVAMRISGDKAAFYNCEFLGFQDTLCDDVGKHYFKDCYIRGTVDFIFGDGRSIYSNCTIEALEDGKAAITAQARSSTTDEGGFSFVNCNITGSGTGKAYLSRAWRVNSRVVFAHTYMGNLINPQGWDDKGFTDRRSTVFYGEYKCMGPGATTDARGFGKLLTDDEAKPFLSMTYIRSLTWLLPPPIL